jgi:large subunit ribosomal protein L22
MGNRKKLRAEAIKEARSSMAIASLNNCPTSPRKMRLIADMIRGMEIEKALFLLKNSPKEASGRMEKLLRSAISNWEQKNEGGRIEEAGLVIGSIEVNGGRMLKRIQPAPQGRAHRIRKRSNHVRLTLSATKGEAAAEKELTEETQA